MKVLGFVEHTLGNHVIVRIRDPRELPRIKSRVLDEKRRFIGVVSDLIGPVSKPYAVVLVRDRSLIPPKGSNLFYLGGRRN
ncbi:MAG: hypothetical protein QXJ51_05110 [Sulfolobales archaeon]|jgi:rRNA processing protein Gar1